MYAAGCRTNSVIVVIGVILGTVSDLINSPPLLKKLPLSESHKFLHHPYFRHEVYGTAYPAFPRYGQDRRDVVEEPLSLAAANPGADL